MYTESGILFSRFTFKKLWQVYRARDEFIYVPLGRWRAECREEEERAERGREAVVPQRANYFPKRDRKLFWYSVQKRIHVHCCEYRIVAYSRGRQNISIIVSNRWQLAAVLGKKSWVIMRRTVHWTTRFPKWEWENTLWSLLIHRCCDSRSF